MTRIAVVGMACRYPDASSGTGRLTLADRVGNVYYVNYMRWQGRCREMFLREHAPQVLAELRDDLKLFTVKVDCEFFAEVTAFEELSVRMRPDDLSQTKLEFVFDYLCVTDDQERLVARGRQRVACMSGPNGRTTPARVPQSLARALAPYGAAAPVRSAA